VSVGVQPSRAIRHLGENASEEGNLRRSNALACMDETREKPPVSSEERAAKKESSRWDAMKALGERKKAEDAFRANYERLKAERLARESKS
jgi:hypothetical protein